MADSFLVPSTVSIRTVSDLLSIKAAATAITTSYVAFPTNPDGVWVAGWDFVRFHFGYTNGDETSIQWYPEGYDGTNWGPMLYKADQATAVSELTPDVFNITKATINTFVGGTTKTWFRSPSFDVLGLYKVRIKMKSTGGTPTGTTDVGISGGILVAGRSA